MCQFSLNLKRTTGLLLTYQVPSETGPQTVTGCPPPAGKQQCLDLGLVPVLLQLVSKKNEEEGEEDEERSRRRKALILYSLRALTSLAEAPDGRRLLVEQLPLLMERSGAMEEDQDIRRAAQTAVRVVTWTP